MEGCIYPKQRSAPSSPLSYLQRFPFKTGCCVTSGARLPSLKRDSTTASPPQLRADVSLTQQPPKGRRTTGLHHAGRHRPAFDPFSPQRRQDGSNASARLPAPCHRTAFLPALPCRCGRRRRPLARSLPWGEAGRRLSPPHAPANATCPRGGGGGGGKGGRVGGGGRTPRRRAGGGASRERRGRWAWRGVSAPNSPGAVPPRPATNGKRASGGAGAGASRPPWARAGRSRWAGGEVSAWQWWRTMGTAGWGLRGAAAAAAATAAEGAGVRGSRRWAAGCCWSWGCWRWGCWRPTGCTCAGGRGAGRGARPGRARPPLCRAWSGGISPWSSCASSTGPATPASSWLSTAKSSTWPKAASSTGPVRRRGRGKEGGGSLGGGRPPAAPRLPAAFRAALAGGEGGAGGGRRGSAAAGVPCRREAPRWRRPGPPPHRGRGGGGVGFGEASLPCSAGGLTRAPGFISGGQPRARCPHAW